MSIVVVPSENGKRNSAQDVLLGWRVPAGVGQGTVFQPHVKYRVVQTAVSFLMLPILEAAPRA